MPASTWPATRPTRIPRPGGVARRCRRSPRHRRRSSRPDRPARDPGHGPATSPAGPTRPTALRSDLSGPRGSAARRTYVPHHTRTVRGDPQILRPRRRLHLGSASLVEKPVDVAITSSLTAEALPSIYTPKTPHDQTITMNHRG